MEVKKIVLINFFSCLIFFIDRITKFIAKKRAIIIPNKNIIFNFSVNKNILLFIIFFILLFLLYLLVKLYQKRKFFLIFSLNLIFLGALSNLIDRICLGYVVDFIKIPFFTVFNLADLMITGGAGLFLIKLIKTKNVN